MSALVPRLTEFIPHVPTPRQQAALLLDTVREGLYGGAAGGGKSDYLLMAALQYADVPGYAALILRRTFSQLSQAGALLPRAQEWLEGTGSVGAETVGGYPTRWDFPSGAKLEFGHCQHDKDRFNFQSGEYQFLAFDELTQFSETIYRYLPSRLRRLAGSNVPIRIRSASNPGGTGHAWVCARFVTGSGLREEDERPFFLPSRLADNPHLDRAEYEKTLEWMLPYERDQLLKGDWFAQPPGSLMERSWFEIIEPEEVPRFRRECRFWDCAGTKASAQLQGGPAWTAGVRGGQPAKRDGPFRFIITHVDRFRENPDEVKRRQIQRAKLDGQGVSVRQEQEPGSAGKAVVWDMRKALQGYDFKGKPSTGDKIHRARPFINAASEGEIALVRSTWNEAFLQEMEGVSIPPSGFMDQFDAGAACHTECTLARGVTPSDLYGAEEAA